MNFLFSSLGCVFYASDDNFFSSLLHSDIYDIVETSEGHYARESSRH